MLSKEEQKRACEATLDDLVEKIKGVKSYDYYVMAVKGNMGRTDKTLQLVTMMNGLVDEEFGLMLISVSMDLLFAMVDQRLRHEILGGAGKNEER